MLVDMDFQPLDEALSAAMEDKRQNPALYMFISPVDEEIDNEWGDADNLVATFPFYTNLPLISFHGDYNEESDAELIEKVKDEKEYVSKLATQISEFYEVDKNIAWRLTPMEVEDGFQVKLFIKQEEWPNVKTLVHDFNAKSNTDGFETLLTLDDSLEKVEGELKLKPVTGGLFAKKSIKKENQKYEEEFRAFLKSLIPMLRRI